MTGVVAFNRFGPDSYTVSPNATNNVIDGGTLVMPDPAAPGTIIPATANATNVLGVTLQPTANSAFVNQTTPLYGGNATDISVPVENAAVAWQGTYKLTFAAPCIFGQLLCAAASGQVQPVVASGSSGRVFTDGVLTNGSTTITSATAAFVGTDVGRTVSGTGIPTGAFVEEVVNGTTIVISVAATATATGVSVTLGATTTDTGAVNTVVGICVQPGGVAAGSAGLVRLRL
jgi:hypothetical protein